MIPESPQPPVFTVSELTNQIKNLLEERFPFIWITGEISNLRIPASGHHYFTLKDRDAQISAVMFNGQTRQLKFRPEDGLGIMGMGRVTVYPPRGNYQIILEYMEPEGVGALQLAFEQLKAKLEAEGLFDAAYKSPLPFLPRHVTLVTSSTGAVVHDIVHIVRRRHPGVVLAVVPVRVQGDEAAGEIVGALEFINRRIATDVIVVCRGGGSLEDLQPFNEEIVARAIFASRIPVVSAVGHETDYTIADFVADLRAPTPSAAAEMIVPVREELLQAVRQRRRDLDRRMRRLVDMRRDTLTGLRQWLGDPRRRIEDMRLRVDDFAGRMTRRFLSLLQNRREKLAWRADRLMAVRPQARIREHKQLLSVTYRNLSKYMEIYLDNKKAKLAEKQHVLHAIGPRATLARGYSITRRTSDGMVVRRAADVRIGQELEILLSHGELRADVSRRSEKQRTDRDE